MQWQQFRPKQALNKAFLKMKIGRHDIELFKTQLARLLAQTNSSESEEFHKNLVSDFLKATHYHNQYFINTKDRKDLVIHTNSTPQSSVGVIIEAKKPTNKAEMPKPASGTIPSENLNVKALQELVLYYLRERILEKNLDVKHLVVTNIYEWFIFDATVFEQAFAQNKKLIKDFIEFEEGRLLAKNTDFFYQNIAAPAIAQAEDLSYTYVDLRDYQSLLENVQPETDQPLIALFKLFSPEHLLKLPFANDSNSLDKAFYSELLHIIGLAEVKHGGKKLIERKPPDQRDPGSLLENTILQLDSFDKLSRIHKVTNFGETVEEQFFNVGLELVISWVNRILFLKLLEAQLIRYHGGDSHYAFLNKQNITCFGDLDALFFQVLAKQPEQRSAEMQQAFPQVPYLNSSLFAPTELEQITISISNLHDAKSLPIHSATVLKDANGRKRSGSLNTLEYLFAFLEAYDFASEGSEAIQEENKSLINASVLGLIFEKINGYQDGSFFTPGFITMYMCRETIRRTVIQKFNDCCGWHCQTLDEVYDRIENRQQANDIINNLKICDPAVGSGHFLVSALNEIIAVKNDLRILQDRQGRRLKEYHIEVANDELIITDENGELFEYKPQHPESQRVQETLFHEKQEIIENGLFGVDINPNSVKICRLRLWIELLKNAYYKADNRLETLPNIDINIRCGNSLVHRHGLDADLRQVLSRSQWNINLYRKAVQTYRETKDKEEKRAMETLINQIKTGFQTQMAQSHPIKQRAARLRGQLLNLVEQGVLIESSQDKKNRLKKQQRLEQEIMKLEQEMDTFEHSPIFAHAFEWRFEFPEVLDDNGDFIGFDAIIGNPPYIQLQKDGGYLAETLSYGNFATYARTGDIYCLFYEMGNRILKTNGFLTFITSNKWMRANYGKALRQFLTVNTNPQLLIDLGGDIFEEATVDTNILTFQKSDNQKNCMAAKVSCLAENKTIGMPEKVAENAVSLQNLSEESWIIASPIEMNIKQKIESIGTPLQEWDVTIYRGILTGYNQAFIIGGKKKDELIAQDPKSAEIIKPILRGRDIKRYQATFADLWLIFVPWHFPFNKDSSITGASEKAEAEFQKQYPAIFTHLLKHKAKLSQRNKAETGIRYEWYALQRCAATYYEEFDKEKIVYQEMVQESSFAYDECKGYFCLDTGRIITGKQLKFLLSIMNSKIFFFLVKNYYGGGGLGESGVRMKHTFFEKIPVPQLPLEKQKPFERIVTHILAAKAENPQADTTLWENQIDLMVYKLYSLDYAEIQAIDPAIEAVLVSLNLSAKKYAEMSIEELQALNIET